MSMYYMSMALLLISLLSSLTVEGIKKILNERNIHYSSTLMTVMVAVALSILVSVAYIIMGDIAFNIKVGIQIAALAYLSFLCATVGYDKVMQIFNQIKCGKEEDDDE